MKLKTIILLVSLPIFSFSQTPCDDINVDFPTSVSTETHFLSEGDTIFTQDTFFVATGIYPFYYQSMTADCDSLVQVSVYAPEVADNFMYLPDTVHFNGIGCENEEFIHCMRFQTDAHSSDTHCSLNGEDIGTIAENGSCFTLFVFGLNSINHFPNDLNSYPLQVLSLWDAFSETEHPSFYVNSPLELLHHIREFVPGARIWLNENNDVVIGDNVEDPDNAIS